MRIAGVAIIVLSVLFAALGAHLLLQRTPDTPRSGFDLAELLGASSGESASESIRGLRGGNDTAGEGYARVLTPRIFSFPRDHGPHPPYRSEWWYFTGNLFDETGRRFGYQWVVFRRALRPHAVERSSAWGANQAFMAHFALTDVDGRRFHHFERFARGSAGLAGAQQEPLQVWLEDWSLEETGTGAWRLRAAENDVLIDLLLTPAKPVVLNGEQGLSRKSAGAGNASYYYSISRLETHGILRAAGRSHEVSGFSWLDREWGTSALAPDQQGWDWFALQLDDGSELMFYQLRRRDGTVDPFSSGTLIAADGSHEGLDAEAVTLEVLDSWRSPLGAVYPARWRLHLPAQALTLDIRPVLSAQELDASVRYWEGAVDVAGSRKGQPVGGQGYVELVGY